MERFLRVELSSTKQLEECLLKKGIEPLWTIEQEGVFEMAMPSSEDVKNLLRWLEVPFEERELVTDWETQWSSFAYGEEKEGFFEVDFKTLGLEKEGSLKLKAGPGFGDLSHPTTRLMLKMMLPRCEGRSCIDIGSGSGILSVAALKFGAKEVFACDIDPDAVEHTRECVSLNHLDEKARAFLPNDLWKYLQTREVKDPLILINMIESEQREALSLSYPEKWESLTHISSGILSSDKSSYLAWMQQRGFIVKESLEEEGWSVFRFEKI